MTFPTLETERLHLVEITEQYTQPYFDIMSRDDVTQYYGMSSLKDIEKARTIIRSFATGYETNKGIRWGLLLKENGAFIGTVGLNNLSTWSKKAEVGYECHPDYWGKGLTREAVQAVLDYSFETLDLFRIGAVTFPQNTASIHLLQRLGFQREGTLRGYLYQEQKNHDASLFSLLKEEWKARPLDHSH